jgi:putative transposase
MKLTVRIKVHTDNYTHSALLETMRVFHRACQWISEYAFEHKIFNKRNLQKRLYYQVKARFCLPSQLVVRAFAKVGDAYRTSLTNLAKRQSKYDAPSGNYVEKRKRPELKVCTFRDTGATVYDDRLLTYGKTDTIRLRVMNKRLTFRVAYPKGFDRNTIAGEADLVLENNTFYLLQTIEVPATPPYEATLYRGVDLGMVHIAYDSEGVAYDDPGIERKRVQYEVRRAGLKQKKTKNSRRRLKKMGKKLSRFRKDVNHCIAKRLVQEAKALGLGLAMELLVDFFNPQKVRRKNRAARRSWAFYQLRFFVLYKALRDGVPVALVDAAFSSQECCVCHQIDEKNRPSQAKFQCRNPQCGHTDNADCNAAKVVKYRAEHSSDCQSVLLAEREKRRQQKEERWGVSPGSASLSASEATPPMRLLQAPNL